MAREIANINLCAIVPVYRHESASRAVVEKLVSYELPVVLVDDGNTPDGHEILEQIANEFPKVQLVTNKVNLGKGGAVRSGMIAAVDAGYTSGCRRTARHGRCSVLCEGGKEASRRYDWRFPTIRRFCPQVPRKWAQDYEFLGGGRNAFT